MRGHLVAVPQPSPQDWDNMFLCPVERLPEVVQVVMIRAARDTRAVRRTASTARALHVNGRHILLWVRRLIPHYEERLPDMHVNEAALRAYESVDGVPHSIVESACVADNDDEEDELMHVSTLVHTTHYE